MPTKVFRSVYWRFLALGLLSLFLASLAARVPTATAESSIFQIYLPIVTATQPVTFTIQPFEQQVVELTNALRQQHGCSALTISPELSAAAHGHSQDMADQNYFSHLDLNGHDVAWRAQQAGYSGTAGWENISAGYATAEEVVAKWYNETPPNDGHRRNLLNCDLNEVGVGYATNSSSTYTTYWTQDFGQQ